MSVEMSGGVFGAIFAVLFFLMLAGTAYVMFRALKRTLTFAFRVLLVLIILFIGFVGSVSLWYFSSGAIPKLRPPSAAALPTRSR